MQLHTLDIDNVINGYFITGRITYQYALDHLIDLIDKLDIQRKFQNESFYKRLEIDFQRGCITPPITIAFIRNVELQQPPSLDQLLTYITQEIQTAFVLDGIQRLNTLQRVVKSPGNTLNLSRYLYINVIVCESKDNLLYRMVTLNNGQKPMTARHQIEILAETIYDFNSYAFEVYTEKQSQEKKFDNAFRKSDLINAYISFLSNTTSLDNKKIIEEKLDELVARKIIEEKLMDESFDFSNVLTLVGRLSNNEYLREWLRNGNNLIGFAVGIRISYHLIEDMQNNHLEELIGRFETSFKSLNVSKIKLSRERRKLSAYFIAHIDELRNRTSQDLTLTLADQI